MYLTRARIIAIAIVTVFMSACSASSPGADEAGAPFSEFDLLTVEQSACLFDCPVFELSIQPDGRIRHSGPSFDNTGGALESSTDRNGLAQLAKALHAARIDEMRDSYQTEADGCTALMTDMSTLSFMVSRGQGERIKTVTLYAGCAGPQVPTDRINALIKAIDRVTATGALIEARKRVRQQHRPAS